MSYSILKDCDTDLLRTPNESDAISNNVNAIIATEDENFKKS